MKRTLFAIAALLCLGSTQSQAGQSAVTCFQAERVIACTELASRKVKRERRNKRYTAPPARAGNPSLDANGNSGRTSTSESCLPASIKNAVDQVRAACGPVKVLSTLRRGARIPTGHISLHATCHAEDFKPKSCSCAYDALRGWKYGLSMDCHRMAHIHISVPGPRNEGRFYHYASGFPRTLHAKRSHTQ